MFFFLQRQYSTSSYPYAGWSPPAQSNEVSNGLVDNVLLWSMYIYIFLYILYSYFLERSNSAKITLSRARELFPVEVNVMYTVCTCMLLDFIVHFKCTIYKYRLYLQIVINTCTCMYIHCACICIVEYKHINSLYFFMFCVHNLHVHACPCLL